MKEGKDNDKEKGTMGVATKGNDEVLIAYDEDCFGTICDDFECVVDTGASYHATPNEEFFSSYNSGEFGMVKWENSGGLKIVGIGDVHIETHVGHKLVLKDVRHLPDLRLNLISCGKLDDEWWFMIDGPRELQQCQAMTEWPNEDVDKFLNDHIYLFLLLDDKPTSPKQCQAYGANSRTTCRPEEWLLLVLVSLVLPVCSSMTWEGPRTEDLIDCQHEDAQEARDRRRLLRGYLTQLLKEGKLEQYAPKEEQGKPRTEEMERGSQVDEYAQKWQKDRLETSVGVIRVIYYTPSVGQSGERDFRAEARSGLKAFGFAHEEVGGPLLVWRRLLQWERDQQARKQIHEKTHALKWEAAQQKDPVKQKGAQD
ncbi:hypothetical protein HHK36_000898 [Tetracentron sinense]|uniref:Retrovirus-related Pol polyprotein from transposon TNT 1-94-like beta-barrel domain-containing protein n=1 Tax=Tetracentron sinense TaxID=13715 RepID=A0A835A1V1_TETSI|nr:hypothetical protein HHK36_000898 [Tetracentron sinense]